MVQRNHLEGELSPYLEQHVTNPVDWYPWGNEAFEAAKSQDRPIFLSIGYATCHWCHVMEKESFKSRQVAELLNETFINIKVDREELPQVDSLYMEFAQAMLGGGGGWPLNLVLTPELKPIFAATYMPPEGRKGQLGLKQLALRVRELWEGDERNLVLEQAEQITHAVREAISYRQGGQLGEQALLEMVLELQYKLADPIYGGIQGAPKFPMGFQSLFLLRNAFLHDESRALFLIQTTLEMMHRGGICDHLGGGFSRYAVDAGWMIPHFEKMTYDNATLALVYTEAARMTGDPLFRTVADHILSYLLRDMQGPNGGFFSAEDADSEGEEGRFYTWTVDEIHQILGTEHGRLFCAFYGATPQGNFEGRNVLYIPKRLEEFAQERTLDPVSVAQQLQECRLRLWEARQLRVRPAKDDKMVTAWNGLMIRALAEAGVAFLEPRYLTAAHAAAEFCQDSLWNGHHLLRRYREGQSGVTACVEDYAYLISGLLTLYSAEGASQWLAWAIELTNVLTEEFRSQEGVFYRTDGQDPHLLVRQIEYYDGAEPSGNAVHAENLLRLYQITGADRYRFEAEGILSGARAFLEQHPLGGSYHCMALQRYLDDRAPTIVIALNDQEEFRQPIQKALASTYVPHAHVIWRRADDPTLFALIPSVKSQIAVNGQTTVYLCRVGVCEAPMSDPAEILATLSAL